MPPEAARSSRQPFLPLLIRGPLLFWGKRSGSPFPQSKVSLISLLTFSGCRAAASPSAYRVLVRFPGACGLAQFNPLRTRRIALRAAALYYPRFLTGAHFDFTLSWRGGTVLGRLPFAGLGSITEHTLISAGGSPACQFCTNNKGATCLSTPTRQRFSYKSRFLHS